MGGRVEIDHIVLWVEDPLRSAEFYQGVLGFAGERVEAFGRGEAPFPSVRVSEHTLIDLMARSVAPAVDQLTGREGSAGKPVNHVCFSLDREGYLALRERLDAHGVAITASLTDSFGARGLAPETIYFSDPDGNVLEARHYAR